MRDTLLSSVAAIAFAFGVTAATAQNTSEPRRGDDQSQRTQTDQTQRTQSPQSTGQSQNMPSEQRGDQSNQQGGQNQQGAQAPQQTGPAQGGTQGQSQQDAQAPRGNPDSQAATRDSSQPDASGRIELGDQQQTRVTTAIRQQKIEPVTNLNFAVSVGTAVPSSVRLTPVPRDFADVLPQYRGYSFFVAQREVVIVDPQSFRIVAFVPLSGGGTVGTASSRDTTASAAPPASPPKTRATRTERRVTPTETEEKPRFTDREDTTASATPPASPPKTRATRTERRVTATETEEKPRFTDRERQPVHKDIDRRRSVGTETDVTVGSSRPESVEIEELPPRARRMVPPVRRYRYFEPEDRGPVVGDPGGRPVFPLFDIFR